MAPRTLPGLGLSGFWTLGEDGWNTLHDADLRMLSALAQCRVLSRVTALPGSPTDGDIYIVPSGGDANKIAIRDIGAWVYFIPAEGYLAYVVDDAEYVTFDGAGWTALTTGGSAIEVLDEGVSETAALVSLNFVGAGVTAADDAAGNVTITIPGGGGGAWMEQFSPQDNEAPAAAYATIDSRNARPALDFDAGATQEIARWTRFLPDSYAGGGVTVTLVVALTSATSGTVGFLVSFERINASGLDIDTDSFATAKTITAVTVPGTSGQVLYLSVNFSDGAEMDGLVAGELYRLHVERDTANDTATGDAELLRAKMVEQ